MVVLLLQKVLVLIETMHGHFRQLLHLLIVGSLNGLFLLECLDLGSQIFKDGFVLATLVHHASHLGIVVLQLVLQVHEVNFLVA